MFITQHRFSTLVTIISATFAAACGAPAPDGENSESIATQTSALTARQRLDACAKDPRVVAGLVTKQICAGADIFLRETFNGNGRTCGSCHPIANNTTIDPASVAALRNSNPNDALFVNETNPALANLEISSELDKGGILENVDGFEDPVNKFVIRSVPHVLSLKTSIARDPGDGTASPPIERTGWTGDGAPGNGSLRNFLTGAITQHYTKNLARRPGTDFRPPTTEELDLVLAFQLALGRLNELNLEQVNVFDSEASLGKQLFMDPNRGRCNHCHANAGANFQPTGLNRNFNNRLQAAPFFAGPLDGGFGGQGLASPNFDTDEDGTPDSFGDGTFSTPPLIEAVDTAPMFHTNGFGNLESAITFYSIPLFNESPAGLEVAATFNGPIVLDGGTDVPRIGRFLRVLGGAFNLDIAKQRLQAALTLVNRFGNEGLSIQLGLVNLAEVEIDDALEILTQAAGGPLYPVAQERLGLAKQEIAAARAATSASQRAGRISTAHSRVLNARDHFGANINFTLGQGNLMF
jgi:hypothetical protein